MLRKRWLILLVIAVLALAGWRWQARHRASTTVTGESLLTLQPADLLISITESGTLKAVQETTIIDEVDGQSRIAWVVDEGTVAKKGDLLVELDSSDLADRLNQQEVNYENAVANDSRASTGLEIQKSQNDSDIKQGELNVEYAKLDLEKYRDGQAPADLNQAQSSIILAQAALAKAKDRLAWTEKLSAQGYATRSDLDADKLAVQKDELDLAQAQMKLQVLTKYEQPQQRKKLAAEVERLTAELGRIRQRADSNLEGAKANAETNTITLKLQETKLNRLKEQLAKTRITAPRDGLVIYATSAGGGGRAMFAQNMIQQGTQVNKSQELIKLPDVSQMKVEVKIHEARMQQLREGLPVVIAIESLPDQHFHAHVSKVSLLPDAQSSWFNPDLKVYSTECTIDDPLPPGIKPGLSARAEIILANLTQVLAVPLAAVVARGEQQVVFRRVAGKLDVVPVTVGLYNEERIEIRSGLQAGDAVVLNPATSDSSVKRLITFARPAEVQRAAAVADRVNAAPRVVTPPPGDTPETPGADTTADTATTRGRLPLPPAATAPALPAATPASTRGT